MEILNQESVLAPIDTLHPHPENPRSGDVGAISESISENGFYGGVVAQRSSGHILVGNHRWQAARMMGATDIPVTWVDVDDDRALRILLVDNRTNDLADYDSEALADLLTRLATESNLDGSGYDGDALDELLHDLAAATPAEWEDAASRLRDGDAEYAQMSFVVRVEHQPLIEAAILKAHEAERGEAIVQICRSYTDE